MVKQALKLLGACALAAVLVGLAWIAAEKALWGPRPVGGVTVERLTQHGEARLQLGSGCAPTERRIAYYREALPTGHTPPKTRELWVFDLDSRLDTKVWGVGRAYDATWSPDSARLAFTYAEEGKDEVALRAWEARSGKTTDIPFRARGGEFGFCQGRPVWSPDGLRFAFQLLRPDESWGVFICPADGSPVIEVAPHHSRNTIAEGQVAPNVWSADGSRLAFIGHGAAGRVHICTVDASGGDLQVVAGPMAEITALAWSGDGARLVFATSEGRPRSEQQDGWTDLWIMNADGSGARALTHGTHPNPDGRLAWRPLGWTNDDRYVIARWTKGEVSEEKTWERGLALVDADTGQAISVFEERRGPEGGARRLLDRCSSTADFHGVFNAWAASPAAPQIAMVGRSQAARLPWELGSAGKERGALRLYSIAERSTVELFASVRRNDGYWFPFGQSGPSWTPDGEQIVVAMRRDASRTGTCDADLYLLTLPPDLVPDP